MPYLYPATVELQTSRLSLRRWTESDAPAFLDIYGREEVARWLGPHPRRVVASLEEAAGRIRRWREVEEGLPRPQGLWAVVVGHDAAAAPVGTAMLLPLDDANGATGDVEVGWHLHPAAQGHGYATEAARALLDEAAATGVTQVLALTDDDNVASQAVAARLGMVDEGLTDRWYGSTLRQFRVRLAASG